MPNLKPLRGTTWELCQLFEPPASKDEAPGDLHPACLTHHRVGVILRCSLSYETRNIQRRLLHQIPDLLVCWFLEIVAQATRSFRRVSITK